METFDPIIVTPKGEMQYTASSMVVRRNDASLASARGCLDVLRGVSALIEPHQDTLVELLTLQRQRQDPAGQVAESSASSDLNMLEALMMILSKILGAAGAAASATAAAPDQNAVLPVSALRGVKSEHEIDIQQGVKRGPGDAAGPCHQPHTRVMRSRPVASVDAPRFGGGRTDAQATARSTVFASAGLLAHVLEYIGQGRGQVDTRREGLGVVALVCHTWRVAAGSETLWEPLVKERLPRLRGKSALPVDEWDEWEVGQQNLARVGGSYRRWLVSYGQFLHERRVLNRTSWTQGLVLQYDMWDENDGFCLFSHESALSFGVEPGTVLLDDEGVGTAFNAASRPEPHSPHAPFRTVVAFLEAMGGLRVRITVCDKFTGAKAVLWDALPSEVETVVARGNSYVVTCYQSEVTTVRYGPASLNANVRFLVEPLSNADYHDDQEGQDEAEMEDEDDQMLWRVRWPSLVLDIEDDMAVSRFIWSALGY